VIRQSITASKLPNGVDPAWSRTIIDGRGRSWHILDTHATHATDATFALQPRLTLLCVHGNPTWSLLWRRLLAQAPSDIRVVAVDQLQMGWSDRLDGKLRRLATRIDDLDELTTALGLSGPVVTVAHDWGGPISLGWVLRQRSRAAASPIDVRGVVLMNTAVHQPAHAAAPTVIRIARARPLRWWVTVRTQLFLRSTLALSRRLRRADRTCAMDAATAAAFRAPYATAERRRAIGAFVADIPLETDHPSMPTLQAIAEGITSLQDIPVLLQWGAGDPVFSDRYLRDFIQRLPHADVHRYSTARHLVIEDEPRVVPDLLRWLEERVLGHQVSQGRAQQSDDQLPALWAAIEQATRERASAPALTAAGQVLTWGALGEQMHRVAAALLAYGIRPGDRVAILVPPGPAAIAMVYACWRVGAVVVIADRGLGVRGMRRALRAALPDHVIGIRRGRLLARTLGLPGRILDPVDLLHATKTQRDDAATLPAGPQADDLAAVVFTSGSTGPAKGVRYRHRQIARTCALLRQHYALTEVDVLVAAFAPWAILGPALGIASVIPDMDVTAPASLRAAALATAVQEAGGTVLWASPAALTSVLRSAAPGLELPSLRLVLGAGAPVPAQLLEALAPIFPNAQLRTPYGMTEVLPVSDVTIDEIRDAGLGAGVLVGHALPDVDIHIDVLVPGTNLGEICVRAPHMRDGYDRLWGVNAAAGTAPANASYSSSSPQAAVAQPWHRTGDVGVLESDPVHGERLWVGGRLAHVVWTARGPVAPVPTEQLVQTLPWVQWAAVVGVGPVGTQQVVVIVVPQDSQGRAVRSRRPWVGADRSDQVRELIQQALGLPIAAVLQRQSFPVDVRHQAKIDRTQLAIWAGQVLAGRSAKS